jgi:DNA-binding transcriptional ArsR family regulator
MSVAELAQGFPVSRPAISQHLRVLKDAGLVIDQRHGTRRLYQLDPGGLSALRAYLDQFWEQSLAAFKLEADREAERADPEETSQ